MRRSAVLERVVKRRELSLEVVLGITGDLKRLFHYLDIVVSDSAGRKLYAVADDVVLVRQDLLGVFVEQSFQAALGH